MASSSLLESPGNPFAPTGMSRAPTRRPPRQPIVSHHEVIEISSDDDEPPPPPRRTSVAPSSSTVAELRKQVRRLKDEKEQLKRKVQTLHDDLESTVQKIRCLETQSNEGRDKVVLPYDDLEDIISCNICTNTMFVPYILSGCGHTFCQKCLIEWFDATLRNFLNANPHYNPNQPLGPHLAALLQQPQLLMNPAAAAFIAAHSPPQPQYNCPECRAPVKSAPTENFGMKSLVQMVANARKEAIPPPPARPRASVWEGFFPRRT
ncbi:hypothetical protein CC1G_02056 [Coprinopsis cinerea okayama7|uniref:RING-type domain-containing protein n=1 Tax=Coprinopsis cinerea (strain Okayama-7 / 130 / ATCC MYA-4618 / FGSC 9003) TaxID=240176 RepID=A8N6F3_COPC7|nr:hypothetical protein CC1G_02056 [Coprinopsis cinerea okayama7\|eukprot:XP_001830420.2 hypothetical protein CC1G_02056 [Coprinopsis cinerea okayama7\